MANDGLACQFSFLAARSKAINARTVCGSFFTVWPFWQQWEGVDDLCAIWANPIVPNCETLV